MYFLPNILFFLIIIKSPLTGLSFLSRPSIRPRLVLVLVLGMAMGLPFFGLNARKTRFPKYPERQKAHTHKQRVSLYFF